MAVCTDHHGDVVPVASGFESAKCLDILPASALCFMGNRKVATDTHSLLFCATFHGIVNFSKDGLLQQSLDFQDELKSMFQ